MTNLQTSRSNLVRYIVLLIVMTVLTGVAAAESWPEFRGPRGDGHAPNSRIPIRWSEEQNVAWKTSLPGRGWSTPVVVGSQLWMTSASEDGHRLYALAVDRRSGELVHRLPVFTVETPQPCNAQNSFASPSPVSDGQRVYVYYGTYGVAAIDVATAKVVWSRNDLRIDHQEGPGSSLVRYQNLLITHCDGRDRQFAVALDCDTGETVWQRTRSIDLSTVEDFSRKAFTTPLLVRHASRDLLISPAAQGCYCYGSERWRGDLEDPLSRLLRSSASRRFVYAGLRGGTVLPTQRYTLFAWTVRVM